MQLLNDSDFQSFVEAKQAAAVHFDAEWDVASRPLLRRRMLEAEEVLADLANFGEVHCGSSAALANSIPVPNVPLVAYYQDGDLVAALFGAEQHVRARMERVLRGESSGYNDGLSSVQLSERTTPPESL
jgi:hypothetical protein